MLNLLILLAYHEENFPNPNISSEYNIAFGVLGGLHLAAVLMVFLFTTVK